MENLLKIIFLLVVVGIIGVFSENLNLQCNFEADPYFTYKCTVKNATVLKSTVITDIGGTHGSGWTNSHVERVVFEDSSLNYLPLIIFDKFPKLVRIDVINNNLENILPFRNCSNLVVFYASRNLLKSIPDNAFSACKMLGSIQLDKNPMVNVSATAFRNLEKLSTLYLQNAQLRNLDPTTFDSLIGLNYLNLNSNYFETFSGRLFKSLKKLRSLNLSWNLLKDLPADVFQTLENIEYIYLENNRLATINPKWFDNLTKMRQLTLSNNGIAQLSPTTFDSMPNLFGLWLMDNRVENVSVEWFKNLTKLTDLVLSYNRISSLPTNVFDNLVNLQQLRIDNNLMSSIDNGLFKNNINLNNLGLSENRINAIGRNFIDNLTKLQNLGLAKNTCVNRNFQIKNGNFTEVYAHLNFCFDNYKTTLACQYLLTDDGYTCLLENLNLGGNQQFEVTGNHLIGKSDLDVKSVLFKHSMVENVGRKIFYKFSRLEKFAFENSTVRTVEI